jgi:hypothetical protein
MCVESDVIVAFMLMPLPLTQYTISNSPSKIVAATLISAATWLCTVATNRIFDVAVIAERVDSPRL